MNRLFGETNMIKTTNISVKTTNTPHFKQKETVARIPNPDYLNHPAYGKCFGTPSMSDRIRALVRFIPCLAAYSLFSVIRWENFTKPVKKNTVPFELLSPLSRALKQDGVTAVSLDSQDKQIIKQQLSELIEKLRKKQIPSNKENLSLWRLLLKKGFRIAYFAHENERLKKELYVGENDAPELFFRLRQSLEQAGVLNAASEYLGRSVDVQFLRLTLRDTKYNGKKPFEDMTTLAPRTSQMHVDHVWTIKCLLYLSEVNEQNGPFCYCLGTHSVHIGWLESQIRRANDRASLSSSLPKWRRLFSALPVKFQKKARFGNDLTEGSGEVDRLLKIEKCFTSRDGDLIVFDDKGIHRGGLIDQGTRWALQIRLG